MSIAQPLTALKAELLQNLIPHVVDFLATALADGTPAHDVERGLWDFALQLGRQALTAFFDAHGTGDLGPTLTLPDGQEVRRLEELHTRRYVSVFGEFTLARAAYGSREGQAVAFVPLDNRLQLPASPFSYLLQDWDQSLAMEQAFGQVSQTVARMLKLRQSVDSLEGMNRQMAQEVCWFRELEVTPPPAAEGPIVVTTADCKGVVIRGQGSPTVCGGQRPAGQRANQKRMAAVGAVYTIAPHVRTPAEVLAALFRDPGSEGRPRPQPQHKHVWASLPHEGPEPRRSIDVVFTWLQWEFAQRNPRLRKPTVRLCDGQEALWEACAEYLPDENAVDILDLLHVTPRLWEAAKLLLGARSPEVIPFVRHRVGQILEGKVATVIRGLRRQATACGLGGTKKKALGRICGYLHKNRGRMRYDAYLAQGYPIASGVIEGACRHLIKDRMERAGMHWTMAGAQAMLDLRSVHIGGHWEAYLDYRIKRENERLYPYRELVAGEPFFALAV
jgi:hypothetical protein